MLLEVAAVHLAAGLATSRTFFQPDEFWQSLEVAHRLVFGYGYLTWEWGQGTALRSIAHPALFVPLYVMLQATGLDAVPWAMVR